MNVLDILLANGIGSKNNSQGVVDAQAKATANEAKQLANEAKEIANETKSTLTSVANAANAAQSEAQTAIEDANAAKDTAQAAYFAIPDVSIETEDNENASTTNIKVTKNGITSRATTKKYKKAGTNEDGTMTQKAIKEYVDSSSKDVNLGAENKGKIPVINENGELVAGVLEEETILRAQLLEGNYSVPGARGVEVDYDNKTFVSIPDPDAEEGSPILPGINRCLVDDDGAIIAFYGDEIYQDSYINNYQTMVYIPKFYYFRLPLNVSDTLIKKEIILISNKNLSGFKLHPIFINADGEELDYFLYSGYEGCAFDVSANAYNLTDTEVDFEEDKLSSVTNAKPISGENNQLSVTNAEKLANNRGENWHISNMKAESAIQMLFLCEFATFNGQNALERGISDITASSSKNNASITGSTASLGNETGHALYTTNEQNGSTTNYTIDGYRAISYHGIENPWGNIWHLINNIQVRGNGSQQGGIIYIYNEQKDRYEQTSLMLPNTSDWISNFGYDRDFDWLFIPVAASNANSALPVGDYVWVEQNLNETNGAVIGGHWGFKDYNGPFYYGFDKRLNASAYAYSARLIYIPKKNSIYEENVSAWNRSLGA